MSPHVHSLLHPFSRTRALSDRPLQRLHARRRLAAHPQARVPQVLVCEDDPPTLLQIKLTFERFCCEVQTEVFGSSLFHKLENTPFDLVLMDYQLALADAEQMLEEFLPWQRISTPMVLMSSADRRAEAKELGFLAFYDKPLTVSKVQELLQRFVPGTTAEPRTEDLDWANWYERRAA